MEKYTVFMDWNTQYGENEYTTQSNLYILSTTNQMSDLEIFSPTLWVVFSLSFPYEAQVLL